MKRKLTGALVAGALALGAGATLAQAQEYRVVRGDDHTYRIGRAPEWDLRAAEGRCKLRVWVDDRATVQLRGDQVVVNTRSGERSYDQGSVCNQPLPLQRVEDFRVAIERGRGSVFEVRAPDRLTNYAAELTIDDPQNGGEDYEVLVAWRNPAGMPLPATPLASADPMPWFDEVRACQDRVRGEFLARNRGGDVYLEFASLPARESLGAERGRIHGEGWARNRNESRLLSYECVLDERARRVTSASYELAGRPRVSWAY